MTNPFPSEPLDADETERLKVTKTYWRKIKDEALVTGLAKLEDAAKQLIALTGTLQGLYFAAIAFTPLREQFPTTFQLIFLLPALFWLASLLFATLVFVPRTQTGADLDDLSPDDWLMLRDTYATAQEKKYKWLRFSHWSLILSFLAILLLVGALAFQNEPSPKGPMQIVIVTPTP